MMMMTISRSTGARMAPAASAPTPTAAATLPPTWTRALRCARARPPRRAAQAAAGATPAILRGAFDEPIAARQPADPHLSLINADLAPTPAGAARTLGAGEFAALWVSLVASTTTLMLAASLVDQGMSWAQGIATVFVGNLVTLAPLVLNAHAGTKYGAPFPVLCRAAFGVKGAVLPSLARALVACGWFGINTTIGGNSVHNMAQALAGGALDLSAAPKVAWLGGLSGPQAACFALFWALQAAIIVRGIESIKAVEKLAAPVLVALAVALLAWALSAAGGPGPLLAAPSSLNTAAEFWRVFLPALTAQVGYWATLALNISDFSRYADSQRSQLAGQALGLPPAMAAFALAGLAVASASAVIYGAPLTDPVELLGRIRHPAAAVVSLLGLSLAVVTTNVAANVVGPANAFVSLAPERLSFKTGGLLTAAIGAAICPWRLLSSSSSFISW